MRERIITGVIGVPVLLICSYFGGWLWAVLIGLLALLAAYELGALFIKRSIAASFLLDGAAVLLLALAFGLICSIRWPFLLALLAVMVAYALNAQARDVPLGHSLGRAFTALYVGVGLGAMLALRLGFMDFRWIWLAFLSVWVTDSAAHLVGSRHGRTSLAPRISPHKTWEGALAGLLCATVIGAIYMGLVLSMNFFSSLPLALLFSLAAQVGDLIESAFKRWAGVKDSGRIFPGHGGVLDRFDSLFLCAPLILLLLWQSQVRG
ncbi:MAG: phosphatidate cytidylyltransferase [Clostridiales bacterium]|nr:phosphatidate cytidylyltransferase [Clostridiales bacterium]